MKKKKNQDYWEIVKIHLTSENYILKIIMKKKEKPGLLRNY